jgi:predicted RNase H-like HicB family nuclease
MLQTSSYYGRLFFMAAPENEDTMILQYIEKALAHARYEIIEDEEPYYGAIPELAGVYATGKTLEECRANLMEVTDVWIIVRQ